MVSAVLKEEAWQPSSDLPVVLLTIEHADLAAPIYVVNDRENLTSGAVEYIAFPFRISLPSQLEDSPPTARLQIDNVSREIGQAIRTISSAPTVTVKVVRRAAPNTIELQFPSMRLRNVRYDALTVSGDLEFEDLTREPYPTHSFSPANFPGLVR